MAGCGIFNTRRAKYCYIEDCWENIYLAVSGMEIGNDLLRGIFNRYAEKYKRLVGEI